MNKVLVQIINNRRRHCRFCHQIQSRIKLTIYHLLNVALQRQNLGIEMRIKVLV